MSFEKAEDHDELRQPRPGLDGIGLHVIIFAEKLIPIATQRLGAAERGIRTVD